MTNIIGLDPLDIELRSGEYAGYSPKQLFISCFADEDDTNTEIGPGAIKLLALFMFLKTKYKLTSEEAVYIIMAVFTTAIDGE